MLVVLEGFPKAALERLRTSQWFELIEKRKSLAWVCFFVGGIWSLQNIWLSA